MFDSFQLKRLGVLCKMILSMPNQASKVNISSQSLNSLFCTNFSEQYSILIISVCFSLLFQFRFCNYHFSSLYTYIPFKPFGFLLLIEYTVAICYLLIRNYVIVICFRNGNVVVINETHLLTYQ